MSKITARGMNKLKYKTRRALDSRINKYFADCDKKKEPYTLTGLSLALDITRQTLQNYQKRELFGDLVTRARLRIEHDYEKQNRLRGSASTIFALKNFGWSDKQEVAHSGRISIAEYLEEISGDEY